MDIETIESTNERESFSTSNTSRKRQHPGSASALAPKKTSWEVLKLVETPNFEELARRYPDFLKAWKHIQETQHQAKQKHHRAKFSSCITQEFSIALTRGLLHWYFDLTLQHIPEKHLCPPVPNRFFYVHWIQTHLLPLLSKESGRFDYDSDDSEGDTNDGALALYPYGLDIGVGANCIYPMLNAKFFRYNMVGTDIDNDALKVAQANVEANHLQGKIKLFQVAPSYAQQQASSSPSAPESVGGPVSRALQTWQSSQRPEQREQQRLQFVMTNPPFYDPQEEQTVMTDARVGDGRARTAMTVSEGTYPGGEVGFVTDMIADSLRQRNDVELNGSLLSSPLWYSSMLGKKASLVKLQKLLTHTLGPGHVEVTDYGPGQYTRWFLAWTLARPLIVSPAARLAKHVKDSFTVKLPYSQSGIAAPTAAAGIDLTTIPCNGADGVSALSEVAGRIAAYCESSPGGWELTTTAPTISTPSNLDTGSPLTNTNVVANMEIRENMPLAVSVYVDEEGAKNFDIPPVIVEALRGQDNSHFLPVEGHFTIGATLQVTSSTISAQEVDVLVQLECYRHSARGLKAIEKIRNALEPEVCRTNRRWRRLLQKQQQQ